MNLQTFIERADALSNAHKPFIFLLDFELEHPVLWEPHEVDAKELLYSINGFSNAVPRAVISPAITFSPPSPFTYKAGFDLVMNQLQAGNTFLVNLTAKSKVDLNLPLHELFFAVQAPYKCWWQNRFLFFSPECFVKVCNGTLHAYPMKGTIDATIPHAASTILANEKEKAEHITIVDLIRNDLAQVATHVTVARFRYLQQINTTRHSILQVSSEITGKVLPEYKSNIGSLLAAMLPAGSVSGAPKNKTTTIIRQAEGEPRGYYTGVLGYFDGHNLDCGVNIRYIEQVGTNYFYRSGGGVTARSNWQDEYEEVIQKIYVPLS
ncbi:MAG: aminodeoxychorismate synthase component I [Cyclobacteriaceae bacterium]|nr:aminodeoxychorismate synthase component I [Cyclobacteriaceae bacterium]